VKLLEGLAYEPRQLTQPGCIEGCLGLLGLDVSDAWLWGCSGLAFFTNISDVLCPSAMHSHKFNMNQRGCNVGYEWEQIFSWKGRDDYEAKRKLAWERARQGIDDGHPSVLWEWEWVLVRGYDETGYYLTGDVCVERDGPMPWEELGGTDVGWMELVVIQPGTAAEDASAVKAGLEFAVGFWRDAASWTTDCKGARAAYDTWLAALEEKRNPPEAARTCAIYLEARQLAAAFLRDAKSRLDGDLATLFDAATAHYETAAQSIGPAAEALPLLWEPAMTADERERAEEKMAANLEDNARRQKAIECITAARDAETAGVAVLEKILAQL
jgi:hypothetical protein